MVELIAQIQNNNQDPASIYALERSKIEELDGPEIDAIFDKELEKELFKVHEVLCSENPPVRDDSAMALGRLLGIVQFRSEFIKKVTNIDQDRFSLKVLEVYDCIAKIIRRRIFSDNNTNDILIKLDEVDLLHTDAMYCLRIGALLPLISFDLNARLGEVLCDIFLNLSGYIDKRLKEISAVQHDHYESLMLKKEILDILRVRSFRHQNCCNNFLGIVCLQSAFRVHHNSSLVDVFKIISQRNLKLVSDPEENIIGFCTSDLLHNQEKMETFCKSEANVSISTFSEILLIFNQVDGIEPLIKEMPSAILHQDSLLKKYMRRSPSGYLSVVTKSAFELRPIVHELKQIDCLSCWEEFPGFRLDNGTDTFGKYRDCIYQSIASMCQKMVKLNLSFTHAELQELDKRSSRDDIDRSIFIAATFIFEFLLEVPTGIPCLQETFEDFVSPSFYWLETYLEDFFKKEDPKWPCFYLVKSFEMLIPVVSCEAYKHPAYFKDGVQKLKYALKRFSEGTPPKDYISKHAYIVDMGRSYIAKIEGYKTKIKRAPPCIRYPDQNLLESKNYWILTSIGSSKKLLYKCFDQVSRKLRMIKRLPKSKLLKNPISKGELGYLMTLNHINIVSYVECFDNENHWFMVMEYCEDRISPYSEGQLKVSEWDIRNIGRQLLIGLYYLHVNHVVHRDIKPGNILKDGRGFIKIADFGEAQIIPLTDDKEKFDLSSLMGTPAYMAPECLHKAKVHPSADVWSFGCVLIYLITGKHPWQQCTNDFNILYHLGATEDMPADIDTLDCSDECKMIIRSCLIRNYEERLTCAELLGLPFFSDVPETLI